MFMELQESYTDIVNSYTKLEWTAILVQQIIITLLLTVGSLSIQLLPQQGELITFGPR